MILIILVILLIAVFIKHGGLKQLINKLNKISKIIIAVCFILLIPVSYFVDSILVNNNKKPLFAIKIETYKDGGTVIYYGLGYKVIDYDILDGRNDIVIGGWTLEYDKKDTISVNDCNELKETLVGYSCPNAEDIILPDLNDKISDLKFEVTLIYDNSIPVATGYHVEGGYSINNIPIEFALDVVSGEENIKESYEIEGVKVHYNEIPEFLNDEEFVTIYSEISMNGFTYYLSSKITKEAADSGIINEQIKEIHDEIIAVIIH